MLLDGLAGIMKWITRMLELSELSAACGEIEREGAALPRPLTAAVRD